MQKAFYTSVNNANLTEGRIGTTFRSDPIPLVKEKFLSEFRSNLEKQKVRKNLGIPDSVNLRWENIEGNLDDAPSLKEYIDTAWNIASVLEVFPEIKTIADAITTMMEWVKNALAEDSKIEPLKTLLTTLQGLLSTAASSIDDISTWRTNVNKTILNINNIIAISEKEKNAISNESGLYVRDYSNEIETLQNKVEKYDTKLEETLVSSYTVGGIPKGTSVSTLKDKPVTELLDLILFPTVVRSLVYPTYTAETPTKLVKIGTTPEPLKFIFMLNDAGDKVEETLSPELPAVYEGPDTYTFTGTISYEAGEYLVDSKNQVTNSRVEAGQLSSSVSITTTYPWYINATELELVPYDLRTTVTISLIGNPMIKLPGINSSISSFKVLGLGDGFLPVNMLDWEVGTENLNGIKYLTWTKKGTYNSYLKHELTFTLKS